MTERYFEKFPIINYSNAACLDITERAALVNSLYTNRLDVFYPYDVRQGERPDNIADRYYDDQYQAWILYLTNQITDPYDQWYKPPDAFNLFINKKYGSYVLAVSKYKFFRNNWYNEPDPISEDQYAALDPTLYKFYQANYGNNVYGTLPINYVRKQLDWSLATNQIITFNTSSGGFINDEVVQIFNNNTEIGQGQVTFANTSICSLQHIIGTGNNAVVGTCFLAGQQSQINVAYTQATTIVNNIPLAQTIYWDPVSYWDWESEINEMNKSILVLNSAYAGMMSMQLKQLLGA